MRTHTPTTSPCSPRPVTAAPRTSALSALPRYDLASGVGTVNAAAFVPELAYLGRHH